MRLVYEKNQQQEVKIGDKVTLDGDELTVEYFRPPHSPTSSGKITVRHVEHRWSAEYYVGIIGAVWIEREDRGE